MSVILNLMLGNGFATFQYEIWQVLDFFIRKFLNLEEKFQWSLSQMRFIELTTGIK
jgi:hypothetical protein